MIRLRLPPIPLRLRLTLWYTFSLGLILLLFSTFLYVQVRSSLIAQVDAALILAANQALIGTDNLDGKLTFQTTVQKPDTIRSLSDDFVIYLLNQDGAVLDVLSSDDEFPNFVDLSPGFETELAGNELWRVYQQEITIAGIPGWIQVAQELDPLNATLTSLQTQILWGLPLALLLAGLGGYFLAARALRPIDQITQTAQAITASDLGQRIDYEGPADEVGRLARTFDTMLMRLQTAFERERRFTGDAAHELRTPLTALKGRIEVTLQQPRRPENYVETLAEMEGQVDRLIHLSSDLLFMARLDRGQATRPPELINVDDFLGAVVDQIQPMAGAKGITIEEIVPAGLTLRGEMDLLIRLFLNLLDNAVKYTPKNGRVTVRAAEEAPFIEIAISDTGPGIAAEHLPLLFERFYRVEGDRGRGHSGGYEDNGDEGGAGLGLAIAYEITRAHGGTLVVESEPGEGTIFIVRLPAEGSGEFIP